MEVDLSSWLNSINSNKNNLIEDNQDTIKSYNPYVINRCLSSNLDCIMFVNEMNIHHQLDKDMQYSFFLNSLRKKKRYASWLQKEKIEDLECIKIYYNYSNEKAYQVLNILTKEQIKYIKKKLDKGGM